MDLYEYQAKDLFRAHGVATQTGEVVRTAADARAAAERIGAAVVVKAQVKTGGRGKAGGVKFATTPEEAAEKAEAILGLDIKGHVVHQVLVTGAADIAEEYYVSFLLDRANRTYLAMASKEGGMEIEELAVERPEALARVAGRRARRLRPGEGRGDRRRRRLRRERVRAGRRRSCSGSGTSSSRRTPPSSRSTRW